MTAQTRATLYTYFEVGDKPTQSQFQDLIDSSLNIVNVSGQAIVSDVSAQAKLESNGNFTVLASSLSRLTGNVNVTGGTVMGSPTGGNQGAGTLNSTGLYINGTAVAAGSPIQTVTVQAFVAPGTFTYTPSAGMIYCTIETQAGGGGGGGVAGTVGQGAAAGGGGGGGYARKTVTSATIGASQTVTVGAGGAVGASGNNSGSTGGTSSVGSIISATGGTGGNGDAASATAHLAGAGSGGVGSSGDINCTGGAGTNGYVLSAGIVGSGTGGNSVLGGGAVSVGTNAGSTGGNYGGGGSGASSTTATSFAGGAGAQGFVIITEYCTP